MSKEFEHLLAKCLNTFAEKNLLPNLFGCCKGLGVCDALLAITNFVKKSMDSDSEVWMADLDFSVAFDKKDHKVPIF